VAWVSKVDVQPAAPRAHDVSAREGPEPMLERTQQPLTVCLRSTSITTMPLTARVGAAMP
jgi:hypothetical protein